MSDEEIPTNKLGQVVLKAERAAISSPPEEPKPPIPTIKAMLDDRESRRSEEAKRIRARAMGKTELTPEGWIKLVPEED